MEFEPSFPTVWPIQLGTKTGAAFFTRYPRNLERDVV